MVSLSVSQMSFPLFFSSFNLTPDLQSITLRGSDLDNFKAKIISIMQGWNKYNKKIPQATEKALINILAPKFEIGTSLVDKIGQDEREFFRLTEMQCQMLNFIENHKQAVIRGCAGAGKTVLAVKKAKKLAKQGRSVLFLTYNIMISRNIREECREYKNIKVIHFHGLCLETLQIPRQSTEEFWHTILPGQFFEYIVDNPIKYDAIIIDEAQDFRVEYWDSIPELVKENGWFYIFYDPDQNLFDTKLKIPDLGQEFVLTNNCRNTNAIFSEIKKVSSLEIISDDAPEGSPVEHFSAKSANDIRNILSKILHSLVVNEEISNEHIVILGAHNLEHTSIGDNNKLKTFTIWENQELPDKKSIAYHTYYKFKGCESDVVIILGYNKDDKGWQNKAALYTAMSRAKHKLYIIEKDF